jgi:DNA-binding SARP family transcriptional activator
MIDIKLIGPTVISGAGTRLVGSDLGGSKPRQVFEMLALDLGTPIAKDLLAERLWDGRPPASYIATVESYVCSLRRRLGLVAGRRGPLATTHHGYLLDPEHVRVDVTSVRSLLAGDVADVTLALDLMSGELLADEPYAAWAGGARETLDELLAAGCTRAAHTANDRHESALAVRLAREATRRTYCAEPPVRELMRGLDANGERPQATRSARCSSCCAAPSRATRAGSPGCRRWPRSASCCWPARADPHRPVRRFANPAVSTLLPPTAGRMRVG